MIRRVGTCLLVAGAAVAAPAAAHAQNVYFATNDTALVVLTGDSAYLDLRIGSTGGVSDYIAVLQFDESRLQVIAVDSVPGWGQTFPPPTLTLATDQATVSIGGNQGNATFTNSVARVWFRMDSTATSGALVSMRLDSLLDQAGTNVLATQTHYQIPLRVCRATRRYGDVDVDRKVTSRDALIVLTEAVGIPTSGFELQWGDVDLDGVTSSRDALFVLSTAVALATGTQAGKNVADRCDPLAPAPTDIAFYNDQTGNLEVIASGDTLTTIVPRTTGYDVTDRPGFSPDGMRFVYEYSNQVYAVNRDGSNPDTLTTSCCNYAPQWAPNGTQIAFMSTRSGREALWLMDADGANQYQLSPGFTDITSLAWAADGSRIVFAGRDTLSVTFDTRVWSINPDSTGLVKIETTEPGYPVNLPSISPAGDSISYAVNNFLYVMDIADTLATAVPTMPWVVSATWWTGAGIAFLADPWVYRTAFYRRASDRRVLRLTRSNLFNVTHVVAHNPNLIYVDQVTLDSTSVTFASTTAPAQTVTATVTNSDLTVNTTVPVTWLSRDTGIATVIGGRISPVAVGSTYVLAHVRGWRADSVQVTVQ